MRPYAIVMVLASLFFVAQAGRPGGDKDAEPERIARLIKQLGHDEFNKREAASEELETIGEPALAALRKVAVSSDDAEVRRRAEAVILSITDRLARSDVKSVPPPKDALVLFDGKDLVGWVARDGASKPAWKLLDGGVMEARRGTIPAPRTPASGHFSHNIRTFQTFTGPYRLHVEFRVPKDPGESRGNSGVYLHGRYEIQILDSYGAAGDVYACGAVYGEVAPRVNACKAPGTWQSFDIEFHPPRFEDGAKLEHARVSVHHNGTLIHDKVHIPTDDTGDGLPLDPSMPGPVMLQEHGSPVQFRNIWLLPLGKR
jgi:hypothetical protein